MVVSGLSTERNALRRHLYVMGLSSSPTYRSMVLRRKPQSTFCVCGLGPTQTLISGFLLFGP